jgi:CheY-like chemotaxis protein
MRPSNGAGDAPRSAVQDMEIQLPVRSALDVFRKWCGGHTEPTTTDQVRVLVVDDEAAVRQMERRILEQNGYQILEAADGREAIRLIEKGQALDLLIADLDMPGLAGEEMVRCIRTTRPDVNVLYVTGYIDRLLDVRTILWTGEAFLEKPFTAEGLREAVAMLLYGTLKKP